MTTKQARRGTGISWTDETWNPTVGCSRVSPGCVNCYAEHSAAMVNRTQGERSVYRTVLKVINGDPRWNGLVKLIPERLDQPVLWNRPRRIFVNSMSDLFHEQLSNEAIAAVFGAMAAAPWHTFQVLTKRARRMREWFVWVERAARECNDGRGMTPAAFCFCHAQKTYAEACAVEPGDYPLASTNAVNNGLHAAWPLPNVWLGVSVENQEAADERIQELEQVPAALRFLSCEPLIGAVDLDRWVFDRRAAMRRMMNGPAALNAEQADDYIREVKIGWVIAGCESGAGARPCDVGWLRALRDQCMSAGVSFFLKQAVATPNMIMSPEVAVAARRERGPVIAEAEGSKRKPGNVIELPYLDGNQHAAFPVQP